MDINGQMVELHYSNASIIEMSGDVGSYAMNVRCINYRIENGVHTYNSNPPVTINRLLILDNEFKIINDTIMDTITNPDAKYTGIEDIRLYNQRGTLYYSGSYYDTVTDSMQISNNMYNITANKLGLTPNIIKVEFKTGFTTEKNWVYFDYYPGKCVIYQWYPLKICRIVDTNRLVEIDTKQMPEEFKRFSGSSCGVVYDKKIWFLVHVRINNAYYHSMVCFDEYMNLVKYSSYFNFEHVGIEYCMSFIIKGGTIAIPYTVEDTTLKLGIYDRDYILNELEYISG